MKKKEINTVLEALKTIKMPKIEDVQLKNALLSDFLFLIGAGRKFSEQLKDLQEAHLAAYADELSQVQELERQIEAESDEAKKKELLDEKMTHRELFAAVTQYNIAAEKVFDEEVSVPYLIDQVAFVQEIQKQDFTMSLFESLYPLFNN